MIMESRRKQKQKRCKKVKENGSVWKTRKRKPKEKKNRLASLFFRSKSKKNSRQPKQKQIQKKHRRHALPLQIAPSGRCPAPLLAGSAGLRLGGDREHRLLVLLLLLLRRRRRSFLRLQRRAAAFGLLRLLARSYLLRDRREGQLQRGLHAEDDRGDEGGALLPGESARERNNVDPPPPGSPFLDSFFSTTTKKKQISCGQCKCCQPLGLALKSLGLSALADALAAADPQLGAALKNPATEVTLLAPAGFKAGGTPLDAAAARRHVLPAMNGTGALWTRELLLGAGGGQVESAERGAPVLVKGATLTSGGGGKTATIVDAQSNIEACKSLIHVIDGVL